MLQQCQFLLGVKVHGNKIEAIIDDVGDLLDDDDDDDDDDNNAANENDFLKNVGSHEECCAACVRDPCRVLGSGSDVL